MDAPSSSLSSAAAGGQAGEPISVRTSPVNENDVDMTQAGGLEEVATFSDQQKLVSNTMSNLSIRPPIGQTPLFQQQAIVSLSVQSIGNFFSDAENEYKKAKQTNFRSIDWSIPFNIPTQRIFFHLWSRRFAISYVQFYSKNKLDARIGDYDFGSASSRLRMVRSLFAQQTVAWDVLIANDAGKWLDRILIGAQSRQGDELAQQFENFLMGVAKQEARGESGSSETVISLTSTSGITEEDYSQLTDRANFLSSQVQDFKEKLLRALLDRIKESVNNMDLSFYMGPDQELERLVQEKASFSKQVEDLTEKITKLTGEAESLKKQAKFAIRFSVSNSTAPFIFGRNEEVDSVKSLQEKIKVLERKLELVGKVKEESIQLEISQLNTQIQQLINEKNTYISRIKDQKETIEQKDKNYEELNSVYNNEVERLTNLEQSLKNDYVAIKERLQSQLEAEQAKSEGLYQQLWALYRDRIQRSLGVDDGILGTILEEYGQPAISFLSLVPSSGST